VLYIASKNPHRQEVLDKKSGRKFCMILHFLRGVFTPQYYSHLSLALAAFTVCHCMLLGASAPPRFSATLWSITYPGHDPDVLPVEGQGLLR
jgi:hypothetical protein